MAFQWYQWDQEKNRAVWTETETNQPPGPGWEASDVPLFDSDLYPRPEAVTVQEDPPIQWWDHHPARRPTSNQPRAIGLFQGLEPGDWPEFRRAQPVPAAAERSTEPYRRKPMHWARTEVTGHLDAGQVSPHPLRDDPLYGYQVLPLSMMGYRPQRPDRALRMRAWHRRIRRLTSATRVPTSLPRRSGLRLAGFRPLTSGRRR